MITARETEGGWLITFPSVAFGGDEECALDDFEGRKNGIRLVLLPQSQYRSVLDFVDKARLELGEIIKSVRTQRHCIGNDGALEGAGEAKDNNIGLPRSQSRDLKRLRLIVAHLTLSFVQRLLPAPGRSA